MKLADLCEALKGTDASAQDATKKRNRYTNRYIRMSPDRKYYTFELSHDGFSAYGSEVDTLPYQLLQKGYTFAGPYKEDDFYNSNAPWEWDEYGTTGVEKDGPRPAPPNDPDFIFYVAMGDDTAHAVAGKVDILRRDEGLYRELASWTGPSGY